MTNNHQNSNKQADPVLEVETWKDAVYEETKNMTIEQLKRYYREALQFMKQRIQTAHGQVSR